MKKLFSTILAFTMMIFSVACGNENSSDIKNSSESTKASRILIAYFSVAEDVSDADSGASVVIKNNEKMGNTEYVAKVIQKTIGGDLFEIKAKQNYPLDHDELVDFASDEQSINKRPPLLNNVENFEQYETVILGYPNWWGDMPMPVYTFLEEYDFNSKNVIPFVTHGGSGFSSTVDTISEILKNADISENTLSISRDDVADGEDEIINWANSLGITGEKE